MVAHRVTQVNQPIPSLTSLFPVNETHAGMAMDGRSKEELIPANWVGFADEGQYEDESPHRCLQVSMLRIEQFLLRQCHNSTAPALLDQASLRALGPADVAASSRTFGWG